MIENVLRAERRVTVDPRVPISIRESFLKSDRSSGGHRIDARRRSATGGAKNDYANQTFQKNGSLGLSLPITLLLRARSTKYSPYLMPGTSSY